MHQAGLTLALARTRRVVAPITQNRSDGQLLTAFLATNDTDAFAELVVRYGPMVFAVCRRGTGHHQNAEDAFQATFVVLARKAATIVPREAVGSWLHGVAVRTAREARAMAAKRLAREVPVAHPPEAARPDPEPDDRAALIHEELAELPDKFRTLLVLCDLRGEPQTDVAARAGTARRHRLQSARQCPEAPGHPVAGPRARTERRRPLDRPRAERFGTGARGPHGPCPDLRPVSGSRPGGPSAALSNGVLLIISHSQTEDQPSRAAAAPARRARGDGACGSGRGRRAVTATPRSTRPRRTPSPAWMEPPPTAESESRKPAAPKGPNKAPLHPPGRTPRSCDPDGTNEKGPPDRRGQVPAGRRQILPGRLDARGHRHRPRHPDEENGAPALRAQDRRQGRRHRPRRRVSRSSSGRPTEPGSPVPTSRTVRRARRTRRPSSST